MDIGLLVVRVVVGSLIAGHGLQKLYGMFGGAGIDSTASFFEQIGLRPGRTHAKLAGASELGAGVLLILGFFTPIAAILLISVMTAAIITVHAPNGPWVTEQGYEYNLVLMAIAFALAGIGAGSVSLDNAFALDLSGAGWAIAAAIIGVGGGYGAVIAGRHEGSTQTASPTPG